MEILYTLRTILVIVFVAAYMALVAPPFILYTMVTGSPELLYRVAIAGVRAVDNRIVSVPTRGSAF